MKTTRNFTEESSEGALGEGGLEEVEQSHCVFVEAEMNAQDQSVLLLLLTLEQLHQLVHHRHSRVDVCTLVHFEQFLDVGECLLGSGGLAMDHHEQTHLLFLCIHLRNDDLIELVLVGI